MRSIFGIALPNHQGGPCGTIGINPDSDKVGTIAAGGSPPFVPGPESDTLLDAFDDSAAGLRRFALEFGISGIPAGATINSATLSLTHVWGDGPLDLHGYPGDGVVDPADMLAENLVAGSVSTFGLSSIDVTAFVQSLVDGGGAFAGFTGRSAATAANAPTVFSKENDPALRPVLTVEFILPDAVPTVSDRGVIGMVLLFLAVLGWSLAYHRRSSAAER